MDNRFVVRINEEKFLCFYYEKGNILQREIIAGTPYDKKIVAQNVKEYYTVNLCRNGQIYIFCQTLSGDILHLKQNNNDWDKNIILKNNGKNAENILFYCLQNGSRMSLIYNIPSRGKNYYDVLKQAFDGKGNWNSPEKIDTVIGMNDFIFKIFVIDFGYGIIFYQKSDENNKINIGYREFNIDSIGNYNSVYSTNYRISAASFLPMNNGVHFIFSVKNIFSSRIIYRKKDSYGMNDYIVLGETQQIESCELFAINNKLYAFWKNNFDIFYCISEDNGNSFSKPLKYKGKLSNSIRKASYLSFPKMSYDNFFISNLYTNKNNICDFQIIPNLCKNFIINKSQINIDTNSNTNNTNQDIPAQVQSNNINNINNINDINTIEKLKNQVNMLNSQIAFKDKQIEQLTSSIQRKNEEILLNDRSWREKYRLATENNKEKVNKAESTPTENLNSESKNVTIENENQN